MAFIQLTNQKGEALYIKASNILAIRPIAEKSLCEININHQTFLVKEAPKVIIEKINKA